MPMSSTYVLLRVLPSFQRCNPCIFVMCVVTSTSLQSGALANSVFRDLVISPSHYSAVKLFHVHRITSSHPYLRFVHVICQIVRLEEYIISFHWIIYIWAHLDARNAVGRGLCDVSFCFLTDYGHLSFLPCLMCASYELEPYMCFGLCHAIFTGVYAMYFCDQCGD